MMPLLTIPTVTTLPVSNYSAGENAFDSLSAPVKKWVWKQGWKSLRDIQIKSIPILMAGGDVIISAATAGGKTEAAFLPLLSKVSLQEKTSGFDVLYISPLKALINDQHERLKDLCEDLDIPATKWHGDVSASIKQKAQRNPQGVLLITPESLESLLMRKGLDIPRLFGGTQAVVIDELHAFMGTERGVQLRSLLNRLEILIGKRIDRIGLSATLGDMQMAAQYLRSDSHVQMPIVTSDSQGADLKLQLRSYIDKPTDDEDEDTAQQTIAKHIFSKISGSHNLVFAGSKKDVELYGATLRDLCANANRPNEFFTHHANISKPDREALEKRLKAGRLPTTAVCTSTLELGIDIGDVETVVQIGAGGSVSALRQRMGRSGRRGGAAILRAYDRSFELSSTASMMDFLQPRTIQAMSEIELLLSGRYEPPAPNRLHLSTFMHQVMALIKERGGANPKTLFDTLCKSAPFNNVNLVLFKEILTAMAREKSQLIEQAPDGTIMLGKTGEKLVSHYSFYAVFETQDEFRVICSGKVLGTLPMSGLMAKGYIIIFSGRRWKILDIRLDEKVVEVKPSQGGEPPAFDGKGFSRHRIIDEKMREIYTSTEVFRYLESNSKKLLQNGRDSFLRYKLDEASALEYGDGVVIYPWAGSEFISALMMIFQHYGYEITDERYAIVIKGTSLKDVRTILKKLSNEETPDFEDMAWSIKNKASGQYDHFLTDEILVKQIASMMPSSGELQEISERILSP